MSAKVDEIASIARLTPGTGLFAPGADRLTDVVRARPPFMNTTSKSARQSSANFAQEQVRRLIQRVYSPGWPKPLQQVVISSIDEHCNTGTICARVALEMANTLPGSVCAVEADQAARAMTCHLGISDLPDQPPGREASFIAENLWLKNLQSSGTAHHGMWFRAQLDDLRKAFDYTLVHAGAACLTETAALGQCADGVILVIEAAKTHRAVAQKAVEVLRSAGVAILGTILTERVFPIPEKLYRKL